MAKIVRPANVCRDCKNVTPETKHNTLSVKGEPTLGTCPYWEKSRCVLLSQDSCKKFELRR